MPVSHFLLMLVYTFIVSAFFALLWRQSRRDQVKLFLQIFLGMILGSLLVAWIMFPFPSGPPAPLP